MASRHHWHLSALSAVIGAALLAACGGGDSEPMTTRVVAFGDSLSDGGAYTPATQIPLGQAAGVPPFFGGKFTTNTFTGYSAASNSSTATVWVEWIAARAGVPLTPHEVGFGPQTVKCPAASTPGLGNSCTNYAQGGSRITSPAGVNNPNGTGLVGANPTMFTRPLTTQVQFHLTKFGSFAASDIVFVWGGHNDAFIQLGAVAAAAITPAAAVANMQTAATELANLVKNEILAKGAARVAVLNLVDIASTPGYSGLPAANKALLTQLTAEFNATLVAALSGTAARMVDVRAYLADAIANPSKYGLTNTTTQACDKAKIQAITGGRDTSGSSLFCNASPASAFVAPVPNLNGLKTGASASTYLFADDVHPTTGGHKVAADFVWEAIKGFGWVPSNL